MPTKELAKVLNVDAILYTDCMFLRNNKPTNSNVATAVVVGAVLGSPKIAGKMIENKFADSADINMKLYDGASGNLLYSYDDKFKGLDATSMILNDKATKKIITKMP